MAQKFHVSKNGEPGVCRAQEGNCPLGSSDEHYSSKEEAAKAFEEKNSESTLPAASKKNGSATLPLSGETDQNGYPRIQTDQNGEYPVKAGEYRLVNNEDVDFDDSDGEVIFGDEENRAVMIDGQPVYSFTEESTGISNSLITEQTYQKLKESGADLPSEDSRISISEDTSIGNFDLDTNSDTYLSFTVGGERKSGMDFLANGKLADAKPYSQDDW